MTDEPKRRTDKKHMVQKNCGHDGRSFFFEKHTGGQPASAQPAIMPVKAVRAAMMTCITMLQKVFLDSFMILLGLGN